MHSILNEHNEEILDAKDRKDFRWKMNLVYGALAYTCYTPLYSIYCISKIKQNPELRPKLLPRIIFMPFFSLFTLIFTGN
jgi:hypothetical protein